MPYYQKGKVSTRRLWVVAIFAAVLLSGIECFKKQKEDQVFQQKLSAARLMKHGLDVIKSERLKRGINIDRESDPNETGIIGADYTDLTSSLGSLSSKRTSANPNFAAVVVEMLSEAGIKPGDGVAISFSGSFPALNIAVLSAVKVLKLNPAVISSLGSSMYGANHPALTWLDMEKILKHLDVFPYPSLAASLGGIVDTGGGLDGTGIELGMESIRRNEVRFIEEHGVKTIRNDIEKRMDIYNGYFSGKKPAAYINVGGSLAVMGNCPEAYSLSTGLLQKVPRSNHPERGVIFRMGEEGIPVIHLLDIKKIAVQYGLPVDPVPLPEIPSGSVMEQSEYRRPLAASALVFLIIAICTKKGARARSKENMGEFRG